MAKERIDLGGLSGAARERFVARSAGTSFDFRSSSSGTEIDIYDEISRWGISASYFRARLKDASGDLTIRINSPGGIVTEGIAIYNDLLAYKGHKRVEITGLAASMATVIAMAGDEIAIAENAFFMIHNAWGLAIGDHRDMQATAEILAKMSDAIGRTYAANTSLGIRAIKEMMDKETWFTGKEAHEQGFATELLKPVDAKAKFDLSAFSNTPVDLDVEDDEFSAPQTTDWDIEKRLMRDAGLRTRSQARALIKEIRSSKASPPETMPGAGGVVLDGLANALKDARQAFATINHTKHGGQK